MGTGNGKYEVNAQETDNFEQKDDPCIFGSDKIVLLSDSIGLTARIQQTIMQTMTFSLKATGAGTLEGLAQGRYTAWGTSTSEECSVMTYAVGPLVWGATLQGQFFGMGDGQTFVGFSATPDHGPVIFLPVGRRLCQRPRIFQWPLLGAGRAARWSTGSMIITISCRSPMERLRRPCTWSSRPAGVDEGGHSREGIKPPETQREEGGVNMAQRDRYLEAAGLTADWLLNNQLRDEMDANRGRVLEFVDKVSGRSRYTRSWDTGIAILALLAMHSATGEARYLEGATLAGEYVKSLQCLDPAQPLLYGAFRELTPQTPWLHPRDTVSAAWGAAGPLPRDPRCGVPAAR